MRVEQSACEDINNSNKRQRLRSRLTGNIAYVTEITKDLVKTLRSTVSAIQYQIQHTIGIDSRLRA